MVAPQRLAELPQGPVGLQTAPVVTLAGRRGPEDHMPAPFQPLGYSESFRQDHGHQRVC